MEIIAAIYFVGVLIALPIWGIYFVGKALQNPQVADMPASADMGCTSLALTVIFSVLWIVTIPTTLFLVVPTSKTP